MCFIFYLMNVVIHCGVQIIMKAFIQIQIATGDTSFLTMFLCLTVLQLLLCDHLSILPNSPFVFCCQHIVQHIRNCVEHYEDGKRWPLSQVCDKHLTKCRSRYCISALWSCFLEVYPVRGCQHQHYCEMIGVIHNILLLH